MKKVCRISLFLISLALLSACELPFPLPWQAAKKEMKASPEVESFYRESEPAKVKAFEKALDRGEMSRAINRVVDPPGLQAECDHIPIPSARPTDHIPRTSSGSGVCQHFNQWLAAGVPKAPLQQMLKYFEKNQTKFKNQRYLSLADYSQDSSKKRFYLLDRETGEVSTEHVSHGSGYRSGVNHGDRNHDGMMDRCSHGDGSRTNMTRVGFFQTAGFYFSTSHDRSKKGRKGWPNLSNNKTSSRVNGMRLVGLSSTNSEALPNGVVMHEAYYNQDAMNGMGVMGRSYGCPAFLPGKGAPIMDRISGGSLFYGHSPDQCPNEMKRGPLAQVSGWESMCER